MPTSLRVAVIGLDDPAKLILMGLIATSGLKLVGLADRDRDRLDAFARSNDCPTYLDQRIMLIETKPQIVFINAPRHQEAELLSLAAELGIAAVKPFPLGRNFDEAVTLTKLFDKAKLGLFVHSPYRYSGGFDAVSEWIGQLGQVHLIQDECFLTRESGCPTQGWQASKAQAGGGVLLDYAYPGLELITSQFGLPELVHCVTKTGLCAQSERPYETEDLSTLKMIFGSGTLATSLALRVAASNSRQTIYHGARGQLTLKVGSVGFRPVGDQLITRRFRDKPAKPYARQARELLQVLRSEQAPASTAREHLQAMAIIEAAYLSSRTGQPESPSHFYELHDLVPPAPPVITSPAD